MTISFDFLGEGKRMSISSALSSVLKKATQSAFPSIRENPAIEYSANGFRFVIVQVIHLTGK